MFKKCNEFLYYDPIDALPDVQVASKSARVGADRIVEMTYFELAFLCGLIKQRRPAKIVEVGVAAGGSSAAILKTLEVTENGAQFISIDIAKKYYANKSKKVGYVVEQSVPALTERWDLRVGSSLPEHLEAIGGGIDFCLLDTAHALPGELLDFIAVLPYLSDDAVVVLHDVHLHHIVRDASCIATKIVLDCACGDKILCHDEENSLGIPNIAAICITEETRKNMANCFLSLMLPWSYMPSATSLHAYRNIYAKHYESALVEYFDKAVEENRKFVSLDAHVSVASEAKGCDIKQIVKALLPYGIVKLIQKSR